MKNFTDNEIDTTSAVHFLTAFAELQTADYSGRWQPASTIISNLADKPAWEVPVGVINIDYNTIDERAIEDKLLGITNYQGDSLLVDIPNRSRSPYLLHTATLASPLKLYSNSLTPGFHWEVTRQDSQTSITKLEVDFNLGNGWQDLSSVITPSFPNYGVYYLDFKITLSNGAVKINRAKFEVSQESTPAIIQQKTQDFSSGNCLETQGEFYATRSFQGYDETQAYYGKGEYKIYPGGSELDSLVVVVDGFDPGEGTEDGKDVLDIYDDFNQQRLAKNLQLEHGFDIVSLNFKNQVYFYRGNLFYPKVIIGGTDYIERNAMVLVTLLEKLNNSCKIGNQPIKVVGFSMGGLIARYALAYMEQENIDHNVDLFVSVDSPHQGAVLPKGLQDLTDLVDDFTLGIVNNPESMLRSPAAKQLLKHHISSNSALPQGAPNFHDRFFDTLDQMGYPQDSRNISVIDGTLDGSATNEFGQQYAHLTGKAFLGGLEGNIKLNYSPEPGKTINDLYFRLSLNFLFFNFTIYKRERSVSSLSSLGSLENAPGGYYPVDQVTDDFFAGWFYGVFGDTSPSILENFIQQVILDIQVNLNNSNFSFVPSKSSLDFTGNPYLYEKINNRDLTCSGETPFDSYYAPSYSQPHTYLGLGATEFIKKEMLGKKQKPYPIINTSEDMNGPEVICGTNVVYSLSECGAAVISWTVSSNLQIINQADTYVTVKADNPDLSNNAYVEAEFTDGTSIRKDIFIGKPSSLTVFTDPSLNEYSIAKAIVTGENIPLSEQNIDYFRIEEISSYGFAVVSLARYDDKVIIRGQGTSNDWSKRIRITATNACGTTYSKIFTLLPPPLLPPDEPCYTFESTSVNVYRVVIPPEPCGNNTLSATSTNKGTATAAYSSETILENKDITISIFNFSGLLLLETHEKEVDLNAFKDGIYILKAKIDGKTYTKKVLKN